MSSVILCWKDENFRKEWFNNVAKSHLVVKDSFLYGIIFAVVAAYAIFDNNVSPFIVIPVSLLLVVVPIFWHAVEDVHSLPHFMSDRNIGLLCNMIRNRVFKKYGGEIFGNFFTVSSPLEPEKVFVFGVEPEFAKGEASWAIQEGALIATTAEKVAELDENYFRRITDLKPQHKSLHRGWSLLSELHIFSDGAGFKRIPVDIKDLKKLSKNVEGFNKNFYKLLFLFTPEQIIGMIKHNFTVELTSKLVRAGLPIEQWDNGTYFEDWPVEWISATLPSVEKV